MSGWQDTPPTGPNVLMYDAQLGEYRLFERLPGEVWRRRSSSKTYSRSQLETCALRSGWRFHAIDLPSTPENAWEDV